MVGTWLASSYGNGSLTGGGSTGSGSSKSQLNPEQDPNNRLYNPNQWAVNGSAGDTSPSSNGMSYSDRSDANRAAAFQVRELNARPIDYAPQVGVSAGTMPTNSLDPIMALVQGMYAPQQEILGNQLARQQQQLGMIGLDVQHSQDVLRRDNTLGHQLLGLDSQANALDAGLVNGQLGNLSKLRDILAAQRGLTREQFDNQMSGFKIDEDKARDMAGRNIFDLRSDLTGRGAFNTVANDRGTGRINRDLDYSLRGINNQRTAADIQFRNGLLGLDEKGIGYDNQELALRNKLANIGLDAKRIGIEGEQLNNALADGLWNSGMAGFTNMNQVLDAIDSTNQQQAQIGMNVLQTILGYSNLPPEVIQALLNALHPPQTNTTAPPTRDPDKYAGR